MSTHEQIIHMIEQKPLPSHKHLIPLHKFFSFRCGTDVKDQHIPWPLLQKAKSDFLGWSFSLSRAERAYLTEAYDFEETYFIFLLWRRFLKCSNWSKYDFIYFQLNFQIWYLKNLFIYVFIHVLTNLLAYWLVFTNGLENRAQLLENIGLIICSWR